MRGATGTIPFPSVRKSQAGSPVAARTHLLLSLAASDPILFSRPRPCVRSSLAASCAPGASLCSSPTSGRRNGDSPFRLFPCHDLRAPWRPAGSVSPRRGYKQTPNGAACLDTNLRRQQDKRGIPGDKPTPTDSRGRTRPGRSRIRCSVRGLLLPSRTWPTILQASPDGSWRACPMIGRSYGPPTELPPQGESNQVTTAGKRVRAPGRRRGSDRRGWFGCCLLQAPVSAGFGARTVRLHRSLTRT